MWGKSRGPACQGTVEGGGWKERDVRGRMGVVYEGGGRILPKGIVEKVGECVYIRNCFPGKFGKGESVLGWRAMHS